MGQNETYLVVGNIGRTKALDGSGAVGSAYPADNRENGLLTLGCDKVVKTNLARCHIACQMAINGARRQATLTSYLVGLHALSV